MAHKKIKVYVKNPGQKPYSTHMENYLDNFQRAVGGYIESVSIATDATIICNEEGRINDLPYNCRVCGYDFFGTIIFVGVDGEEFTDVPISWADFKEVSPELFEGGFC